MDNVAKTVQWSGEFATVEQWVAAKLAGGTDWQSPVQD